MILIILEKMVDSGSDFSFFISFVSVCLSLVSLVCVTKEDAKSSFRFKIKVLLSEYELISDNERDSDFSSWCTNVISLFLRNTSVLITNYENKSSFLVGYFREMSEKNKKFSQFDAIQFAKILRSLI